MDPSCTSFLHLQVLCGPSLSAPLVRFHRTTLLLLLVMVVAHAVAYAVLSVLITKQYRCVSGEV